MASGSGAQTQSSGQDVLHRIARSLGRNVPSSPPAARSTSTSTPIGAGEQTMPTPPPTIPSSPLVSSTSGEPLQRVASSSSSIAKARMKIADRLKQLSRDIGKLRKGSSSKSVPASPRITVGEVSPATGSSAAQSSGHAKLLSMVAELDEPDREAAAANPDDPPSAATLAKRIQSLVDALPFPAPGQTRVIKNPKPPARDRDGRPIPPPEPTPVKDSRLISFLSSPTIMNGSTVKGRPSIWSVLENLGAPAHGFPPPADRDMVEAESSSANEGSSDDGHSVMTDTTSVMVYSPLIPGAEDLVELAEQVPVEFVDGDEVQTTAVAGTSWTSVWPLSIWYGPESQPQPAASGESSSRPLSGEMALSPPPRTSVDNVGRVVRVQTVKAWVPSATKLSLQALWWGYRLYLPPPVLAVLSDKTLEATKRAAMITTALTWFFNNLPVTSLPPPVQPAALLLQRIAPYLGYIGTFISWSWSTIKGYDIGYGVILSATWVLPVALIPSTWKENDFPKSPSHPAPIPLPPQTSQPTPSSPPTSLPSSTSPSIPSTSPAPSPSSPIQVAPVFGTPLQSEDIPIAPTPVDVPPVPPEPGPRPVAAGSPLGKQLLQGPLLSPVPLPDEEDAEVKPKEEKEKEKKSRAKALFTRSPKH